MADGSDLLEQLIEHVRAQNVPVFPRDRIVPAVVYRAARDRHSSPALWRHVTTFRSQLVGASILVVVVCGLVWKVGPFSTRESFGFDKVLNAVNHVRSVQYTVTTKGWKGEPWPDPYVTKVMLLEPGRSRSETDGVVQIINSQVGQYMRVQHKARKVTMCPLYPSSDGRAASHQLDSFYEQLRRIATTASGAMQARDIDGRRGVQFRAKWHDDEFLVTVDSETKLPLRMEVSRGKVSGKEIREVFSDFVFDAPIDESLFTVKPPNEYAVERHVPDRANKSYPADDAETLIVSPGSFGPVTSGMPVEKIIQLLGKPDWIEKKEVAISPVPGPGPEEKKATFAQLEYDSRGFQLSVSPSGDLTISCFGQAQSGPHVRDFVGQTKESIRLGASRDDVIKAYGKPEIDRQNSLVYVALGWQFSFRDGKLCGWQANRPMPKRSASGIQTRVLKDGTILQAAPGVDIDAMIDKNGNVKEDVKKKGKKVRQ